MPSTSHASWNMGRIPGILEQCNKASAGEASAWQVTENVSAALILQRQQYTVRIQAMGETGNVLFRGLRGYNVEFPLGVTFKQGSHQRAEHKHRAVRDVKSRWMRTAKGAEKAQPEQSLWRGESESFSHVPEALWSDQSWLLSPAPKDTAGD